MKKTLALLLALLPAALFGAAAYPSTPYIYTDTTGTEIPFAFGIDTNGQYQLRFPSSVSTAQQNEILALPKFNNFPISGVNPTVTIGPIFPPGPGTPSNWITSDVAESANFNVTAANYGVMFQVTTGAANVTATLPAAATLPDGWYCFLRKADTGAGLVLNSQLSDSVPDAGHVTAYWTDGTNWYARAWYGGFSTTGLLTITAPLGTEHPQNGIGTTPADGLILSNSNGAAVGAQQQSANLHFFGQGWKTNAVAASEQVDMINFLLPVQAAANPTSVFYWQFQNNGGGYSSEMTLSSSGVLSVLGTTSASSSVTGSLIVGNGTAATTVGIGAGNINAGAQIIANSGINGIQSVNNTNNNGASFVATTTGTGGVLYNSENSSGDNAEFGLNGTASTYAGGSNRGAFIFFGGTAAPVVGALDTGSNPQIDFGKSSSGNSGATFTGMAKVAQTGSIFGLTGFPVSAWGSAGVILQTAGNTWTDNSTAGSGTAALETFVSLAAPVLAATNSSVVTTIADTLYIAGPPTAGANQTLTNAYPLQIAAGTIAVPGGTTAVLASTVTVTSGAGAGAGTLTNAPSAGNPTKWIPFSDAGTTRYFPAW
jgi:hypothetical protein